MELVYYGIKLATTYFFIKTMEAFLPVKRNVFTRILNFLGMFWVVNVVIYSADLVNVIYAMVGFAVLMLLCWKGEAIRKISVIMVLYPLVVSLNFSLLYASYRFYFQQSNYPYAEAAGELWVELVKLAAWAAISKFVNAKIKEPSRFLDHKTWVLLNVVCAAPLVSIVTTIINTPIRSEVRSFPVAIACIVTNLGIMLLIHYLVDTVKTRLENQNLKTLYNYYKEMEHNQIEIRKIRHDMNNHLNTIASLSESGDKYSVKEYLNTLSERIITGSRNFCKNSLVNAVINSKYNAAAESTEFFLHIDIDNTLSGIADIDLCSLFSNLLDNAIEASQKIKDAAQRRITVKARIDKGMFSLSVANNKCNEVKQIGESYVSDKEDKKIHGLGLRNVRDIVVKYRGTMEITFSGTEFRVIIVIML